MKTFRNLFCLFWVSFHVYALPLEFSEGSLLRDAEIEEILREFSDPILRVAGLNPKDVRIYLVASSQMNAFSALGNLIFVNTGLITRLKKADELLAVLSHEIGHLSGRHVIRTLEALNQASNRGILIAILGGLVAGATGRADAALAGIMGGFHVAERSFLSYSRGQESAADQAGIRYLTKLHWPLQGFVTLTKQFESQDLLSESRQDLYIRTHPLGKERLSVAEQAVERHPSGKLPIDFQEKFEWMKTKIFAYSVPAKQVLSEYNKNDRTSLGQYARAIAFYRLGNHTDALRETTSLLATAEKQHLPYLHELKAQILFDSGDILGGIKEIKIALSLRRAPSPLLKGLAAQMMIETSQPALWKEAVDLLESVRIADKDNGDVWKLLSIAYGKQGEMGKMSLCLSELALSQGDIQRAKSQAERALHFLVKQSPAHQRAKDILEEINRVG